LRPGDAPGTFKSSARCDPIDLPGMDALGAKTIRQTVTIHAPPRDVYRLLMTTKGHEAFTGATARIGGKVGDRFTAWGGYIDGRNVELVPGKRIVQDWRPAEDDWPHDYYSRVKYELVPVPAGTRIRFTQSGVPAKHAGHLAQGWKDSYWRPLKNYFGHRRPRRPARA
jgi:uncharacterized protein YndB with AHSA1/START domain